MSHIRVSREEAYGPLIPRGKATMIIGFEPLETLRALISYGGYDTRVIMNLRSNYPLSVLGGEATYPDTGKLKEAIASHSSYLVALEATELAVAAGVPVGTNMVMIGAFAGAGVLPISVQAYEGVITGLFSGELLELNLAAFRSGLKAIA